MPIRARPSSSSRIGGLRELLRGLVLPRRWLPFGECEGGIADDARLVSRGIARVAQVDELREKVPSPRAEREPVDRRCTAGLLVIERRVERKYRGRRAAVDLPRS